MIFSALRKVLALSFCLVAVAHANAQRINSELGFRANVKPTWQYLDTQACVEMGLVQVVDEEIKTLAARQGSKYAKEFMLKATAGGMNAILLETGNEKFRDNIVVRKATEIMLPMTNAQASQQLPALRVMMPQILRTPVTVNSCRLVELKKSGNAGLVIDLDISQDGVSMHQIQYTVAARPGAMGQVLVTGSFVTGSKEDHHKIMDGFMKNFELVEHSSFAGLLSASR